jgi:phage gp46-like protein
MLKIIQTAPGEFDLTFDDPALNDEDAAVATLVYAILFVDAEAPPERAPDRYERRGWWAEPARGSGLWHVRRQPLGSAARAETLAMLADALSKADPALKDVQVSEITAASTGSGQDSTGNVSRVVVQVTGTHNGRQFLVKVPS